MTTVLTVCKAIITLGGAVPALTQAIKNMAQEWQRFLLGQRLVKGSASSQATKDTTELEHALDERPS